MSYLSKSIDKVFCLVYSQFISSCCKIKERFFITLYIATWLYPIYSLFYMFCLLNFREKVSYTIYKTIMIKYFNLRGIMYLFNNLVQNIITLIYCT